LTNPSFLNVHAALAGVPPEEVLVVVQLFAPLKLSVIKTGEPVIVVDEKRLKLIMGHTFATDALLVTDGNGFTVTVIVYIEPVHEVLVATGVTRYCTVPAVMLLGLVSTWLIVDPLPAEAPVIPPVIVPIVQEKVLVTLAVRDTLNAVPLHMAYVAALVTTGFG
jgi:hypothetical protein